VSTHGGNIEARTLESGKATLLFVFNHEKQSVDAGVDLRLPAGTVHASDLVAAQPVSVSRDGEFLRLKKRMDGSAVWVVRLTRE